MDFGLPKTYSRVTGATAIRTAWESPEKNLPEAKVWRTAKASLRPQTSPLQRRPAGKADGSEEFACLLQPTGRFRRRSLYRATSMRLVLFDIDGTLTRTMKADEECFVRSLAEVCGFNDVDTDWSRYKHATDSAVFHEIYESRAGRSPLPSEISRFRQHFVALLAQASSEAAFTAVAGAAQLLSRLADSAEHRVALATGAWRDSARLKMTSAGLCYDDYPAASSDDALDRESIIRLSMQRAARRYGRIGSTVYVGDGVWDARACRGVGIPFIGIATDSRAARLSAEGAVCVFPDFSDTDLFLRSLYETTNVA